MMDPAGQKRGLPIPGASQQDFSKRGPGVDAAAAVAAATAAVAAAAATAVGAAGQGSRVLHVRGLPRDVSEHELVELGSRAAHVEKSLLLRGKGQGFLQYDSILTANTCLQIFASNPPLVRGCQVMLQPSSRAEISISAEHGAGGKFNAPGNPSNILLVTLTPSSPIVAQMITIELLQQAFSKFGAVLRMTMFERNGQQQALIEFGERRAAVLCQGSESEACGTPAAPMSRVREFTATTP